MKTTASVLTLALFLVGFVSSCGEQTVSPPPPDQRPEISGNVVIVEESDSLSLNQATDSKLVFDYTGLGPAWSPGAIVVGTENRGFLRRVNAVDISKNQIVLETTPATLTDAIVSARLDTALLVTVGQKGNGVGERSGLIGMKMIHSAPGVAVAEGGINLSDVVLFSGDVGGVELMGRISDGFIGFEPVIDIGFDIESSSIKGFHTMAGGDLIFDCDLKVTNSGALSFSSQPINLATFEHVAVQYIGMFPVVEVITLAFDAGFVAKVSGVQSLQAGFESDCDLRYGARYEHGSWSSIWERGGEFQPHLVDWELAADASAEAYVIARLDVAFYDMAGPYLEVQPYLALDGHLDKAPAWEWELYGGAAGTLGFQVSVLSYSLADYSVELLDWRKQIASDSSNTPPTAEIQTPSDGSSCNYGDAILFTGRGHDPEDGTLSGSSLVWTSDKDGQIGTGSTFQRGDLSVNPHRIILTVTDSEGNTDTDSITMNVTSDSSPAATITAPSNYSSFEEGQPITFAGSGTDPEDGTLSGSSLVWTSDKDGQIGTGSTFQRGDLSVNPHRIILTVTDSEGNTDADEITIHVVAEAQPVCYVTEVTLDFGSVDVTNAWNDESYYIENRGTGVLVGIVSSNESEFQLIRGRGGYSLRPGERWDVTVRFDPDDVGTRTATIDNGTLCDAISCEGFGQYNETELHPVADAYVWTIPGDGNGGSGKENGVSVWRLYTGDEVSLVRELLIKFPIIGSVPPSAMINSVGLELHFYGDDWGAPLSVEIYRLADDWNETSVSWPGPGYFGTQAMFTLSQQQIDSGNVRVFWGENDGLTDLTKRIIQSGDNFGFRMLLPDEGYQQGFSFWAREIGDSRKPKLIIKWK